MKRAVVTTLLTSTMTMACGGGEVGTTLGLEGCMLQMADASVTLKVGAESVLCLASNPTTGYGWMLQPFSPALVEKVGADGYVQNAAPPGMVGVPGTTLIRLRALQSGMVTLTWLYQQPWMPASTAAQSHSLQITVVP